MFLNIGHRGAMGYEPENTLRSIQKALDLNVDMIEIDVYRCQSGEIVLFHDQKLERTTNGKGYVFKKTYEELQKLDAGKGEKIPVLENALDLIDRKAKINIELKGRGTLYPVLHIIERYVHDFGWKYEDFLISAFKRSKLKKICKIKPKIKIGVLIGYRSFRPLKFAESISAYSIHVNLRLISPELVQQARGKGLKVFVWTVNERADIEYLRTIGVDGVFSDFPDRVK